MVFDLIIFTAILTYTVDDRGYANKTLCSDIFVWFPSFLAGRVKKNELRSPVVSDAFRFQTPLNFPASSEQRFNECDKIFLETNAVSSLVAHLGR